MPPHYPYHPPSPRVSTANQRPLYSFGQFAATIILLQTAPIGFVNAGWKYYFVIIIWCIVFIPFVYYYFPETARLSLEEIGQNFGDEVAVHVNDATDEQRQKLDAFLKEKDVVGLDRRNGEQGVVEEVREVPEKGVV